MKLVRVGRNDPCPCGSGKKYKKCCTGLPLPTPQTRPLPAREPQIREFETLLDTADVYEDLLLNEFSRARDQAFRRRDRASIESWLDRIETDHAAAFQSCWPWYFECRMANAVLDKPAEALWAHKGELVRLARECGETYGRVVDLLAWHGHTTLLAETAREALTFEEHVGSVYLGRDEFESDAVRYTLFRLLEETPDLDPFEPALRDRLPRLAGLSWEGVEIILYHLGGRGGPEWRMEALDPSLEDLDEDDVAWNLFELSLQFLGHLHRVEGIPYTRAELARAPLLRYLLWRVKAVWDAAGEPNPAELEQALVPDAKSIDFFLRKLGDIFAPFYYQWAALFQMIPAWLRFLVSRGLATRERSRSTLDELRSIGVEIVKRFEVCDVDPDLADALRPWPDLPRPSPSAAAVPPEAENSPS